MHSRVSERGLRAYRFICISFPEKTHTHTLKLKLISYCVEVIVCDMKSFLKTFLGRFMKIYCN